MPDQNFKPTGFDAEADAKLIIAAAKRVQTASGGSLQVSLADCISAVEVAQNKEQYMTIANALSCVANWIQVIRLN